MADNNAKKPNIFVRMGKRIAKFWRDYTSEMKKVVWMPWPEVRKNTLLVVVASVVIGGVVCLLDFGLQNAIAALGKLI